MKTITVRITPIGEKSGARSIAVDSIREVEPYEADDGTFVHLHGKDGKPGETLRVSESYGYVRRMLDNEDFMEPGKVKP